MTRTVEQADTGVAEPDSKKARTHARILDHAARLFRLHGYSGVGIDTIMAAAGLTRGGFYAHFSSKGELFAQVLAQFPDLASLLRAARGQRERARPGDTRKVIDSYLSLDNTEAVYQKCSLTSLAADAARGDPQTRASYADALRMLMDELRRHVQRKRGIAAQRTVLVCIALCIGGLSIARALDDDDLADRLLTACRKKILSELTQ